MSHRVPKVLIWYWGRRGGGATYTLEMVRALQERSDLALHLSLSRQNELFGDFAGLGLPGCHVDTVRGPLGPAAAILSAPWARLLLARYIRDQEIDVVYGTMSTIWSGLAIGALGDTPYLHTVHDAVPHPGERVPLPGLLVRREIEASHGLVVLSEHVCQQVVEAYHYRQDRIWTVPHGPFAFGVDPVGPKTAPDRGPWRLMFLGRILDYKGLGLLLEAYRDLRRDHDVRLEIVGGGDLSAYRDRLAALPEVVVDNRWIPEAEMGQVIGRADLVILPYLEASQSGVAPLAYAAGTPVVATPVGGLAEQVRHGETGLIAEAVSAEALTRSIAAMLEDPDLYGRCARGALQAAKGELSWPVLAGRIDGALRQILRPGP